MLPCDWFLTAAHDADRFPRIQFLILASTSSAGCDKVSSDSSAPSRTAAASNNSLTASTVTPWNGEWKGQKGPWNLFIKIDGDRVAGRMLSGSETHDIIGIIGPEGRVRARVGNTVNTSSTEIIGPMPAISLYLKGQYAADINMSRTR